MKAKGASRTAVVFFAATAVALASIARAASAVHGGSTGEEYVCDSTVVTYELSRIFWADMYVPRSPNPLKLPLVVYSHGRAPYGSSRENRKLLRKLCEAGYRVIAPQTDTTGSKTLDYQRIKRDIIDVLESEKRDRSGAARTEVFLVGLSRGGSGLLYALTELPYPISGAIAFAARGSTVEDIFNSDAWAERLATPTVMVSPTNDDVTDFGEISSVFKRARLNGSIGVKFYVHAGGTHFGYASRNKLKFTSLFKKPILLPQILSY